MHYCFRGENEHVVGLQLNADQLGQEIYKILDWADENFSSYSVEQKDGYVHLQSSALGEEAEVHKEPLRGAGDGLGMSDEPSEASQDGDHDDGSAAEPAML
jgi:hypothetical protein